MNISKEALMKRRLRFQHMGLQLSLIMLAGLLTSCGTTPEANPPVPAYHGPKDRTPAMAADPGSETKPPYEVVRVYFATDRNRTASGNAAEMFGSERGDLSYGNCVVTLPRNHAIGALESPSLLRFEIREDMAKHVILHQTAVLPKEEFLTELRRRTAGSAGSNAFLFVHGYNVTFENAARRTAQIAYDLSFRGVPVFYSWPSRGALKDYTVDEQNIEWAQANLKRFLEEFFSHSGAQHVFLIAHSMGNRALTRALVSLMSEKPELRERLSAVILAAPDIDAEVFKRDIAPKLAETQKLVTLYASSSDVALAASQKIHGYPRAGDSGHGIVLAPGIETVDASGTDTSFLGHSYFAQTSTVLSDVLQIVRDGKRAENRSGLRPMEAPMGRYWVVQGAGGR